jgi:hypothetical protein
MEPVLMSLREDIAGGEAYVSRANRLIGKHRGLIKRSRNLQTKSTAEDVVEVLTVLLASVEHQHQRRMEAESARRTRGGCAILGERSN